MARGLVRFLRSDSVVTDPCRCLQRGGMGSVIPSPFFVARLAEWSVELLVGGGAELPAKWQGCL